MSGSRVGVFGGTFDPIHTGHLAAAEDAADALSLDPVLLVPNRIPPHKQARQITRPENRLEMARLAVLDNPLFEVSSIELVREGPSYTVDTMRQLRALYPDDTVLVFLVGVDALGELHTWHKPHELLKEFRVAFMDRAAGEEPDWALAEQRFPGIRARASIVHVAQLEISAHDIRDRVRGGRPFRYLLPPPVAAYIAEHGLYRG